MKIKTIVLSTLIFLTTTLTAEVLPSFTITELSTFCDKILEAKFLKTNEETYTFLTKDIHSKGRFTDTLNLNYIESLYANSIKDDVGFTNSEKLIIYISDMEGMEGQVMLSGYRLFKDGKIYSPHQRDNPGGYYFTTNEKINDWNAFKERVIKIHERITAVKKIRDIEEPITRNEKLFDWINQYKNTFRKNCDFDADCGWGMFEWDVFHWITERENAKDTWKASQLLRLVNAASESDEYKGPTILQEQRGNSFKTYKDIDFLINIASDQNQAVEERTQALVFLTRAVDLVYKNNDPFIDSTKLAFQVEKQKSIRQSVYELMNHPDLKYYAFVIVKRLSNPLSHSHLHRTDLSHLPQIIEHYSQVYYNSTEETSYATAYYKSDLARFIVHNASEEQWRNLTGCDANIFVDLKQVHVDTMQNTLSFNIFYYEGDEVISESPTVVITSLEDGKEYLFDQDFEIQLPWVRSTRYIRMDLNSMGLEKGKYYCHLIGRAGAESEFFWKSEFSTFTIGN